MSEEEVLRVFAQDAVAIVGVDGRGELLESAVVGGHVGLGGGLPPTHSYPFVLCNSACLKSDSDCT